MFSICTAVWPVLFLTMSCRLLFHNLAFLAPVAKQTVVQRMWVRCKQRNKTQSWREKARQVSWNDPLRFLHMIPVINEQGEQWFGAIEEEGNCVMYIQTEINRHDFTFVFMYIAEEVPYTTS